MITLDSIRNSLPDYARDLALNLGSVLTSAGSPGLAEAQIWAVALSSAIASRNPAFAHQVEMLARAHLDERLVRAARAAAAIMGMNNVYYRFTHLVEDEEYARLPARLRMSVIGNPGVERADFELCALAVSAINGCGACLAAHARALREQGLERAAVQSAVRIAAVVHAVAGVLEYEGEAARGSAEAAAA